MRSPIGPAIKQIRERKRISLTELAHAAAIETEELERIEAQAVEPAIADLLRIASALRTELRTLLCGSETPANRVAVTRKEERIRVERRSAYRYESLAPAFSGKHLEPFIIKVFDQPRNALEFSSHRGEEFHYVIEGKVLLAIDSADYELAEGDSVYFEASRPHALNGIGGAARLLTIIYNTESLLHAIRSPRMRDIIAAAQHLGDRSIAVVCPGASEIEAINTGIEEGIIKTAFFVGACPAPLCETVRFPRQCPIVPVAAANDDYFREATDKAIALVHSGACQMLMKGQINTALFIKALLQEKSSVAKGQRLSLVSIFELPDIERLVFLTDPGINPALVAGSSFQSSVDIINNAIEAAHAFGIARPKVALLEANEQPSAIIPATLQERELAAMEWKNADVYGPLSYDLALYREAAVEKRMGDNPVAGRADVLVVPSLSGGNFLYKAWAMTLNADVANLVVGAAVPIIMNSRSDSDKTKFLTICASAVHSHYRSPQK
jgi:phosphate butyryltransferase